MGFECPERQTTGDFLTSLTSPAERRVRPGFEGKTPKTPDEFAARWQESEDRAQLLREIDAFEREFPVGGQQLDKFCSSRKAQQAYHQRLKSPYTISVPMQIKLCMKRGFQVRVFFPMSKIFLMSHMTTISLRGSVLWSNNEFSSGVPDKTDLAFYSRLLKFTQILFFSH